MSGRCFPNEYSDHNTGMNIPRQHTLYQGLISLQVKEDELLSSAVQEKLSLVRPRHEVRKVKGMGGPS